MSLTIAAIGGIVAAAAKYLLASKAAEKATEKIAELGGESVFKVGQSAFTRLKATLTNRGADAEKAQRALANVEAEPDDASYQQKLATELEKLAQRDTELRTLLETLSAEVRQAGGGADIQGNVYLSGSARADQVAGVNPGTMIYNPRSEDKS